MDITIKTKFNKGDKVIVQTVDDTEKLPVFVLAKVCDVKRIDKIGAGFNKITYEVSTYKIGECFSRFLLSEEDQMYSLDDFTKLFNSVHN